MKTICGADCSACPVKDACPGCEATGGRPFGGRCVAAEHIKAHGKAAYSEFKQTLLEEINALLTANGASPAQTLYELRGSYINLPYPLPGGEAVRFLDDKNIYLGAQVPSSEAGICCGAAADENFILICRYGENGADPELIAYKKRRG